MKLLDSTVKCSAELDMEGVAETRSFDKDIMWVAIYIGEAIARRYKVHVELEQWVALKCNYDPIKNRFSTPHPP